MDVMWNPFVSNNCNYLIKTKTNLNITIYLTDFKTIWLEEIKTNELITRFQELNPLIDASLLSTDEVVKKILSFVNNIKPSETKITFNEEDNTITLEIEHKVSEFFMNYKFFLCTADKDVYFNEFTLPLMQSVQYLEMRQKMMFDLLERKDKEILEHELERGEISRKSLITEKFDRTSIIDNFPKALFVNIFGKSKEFYDVFSTNFGTVTYSTKQSKDNPRKKLKTEKSSTT